MTILTPELIEKAAEALFLNSGWRDWEKEHHTSKDLWRSRAKVALQAVLPDLVEKCAQVAEGPIYKERYRGDETANWPIDRSSSPYGAGRIDSAASIRSLLNKEDK